MFFWRRKRRNRISKEHASARNHQFAKTELDANESQRPDGRVRELSGDMAAHELGGEKRDNNNVMWELPGNMKMTHEHELEGGGGGGGGRH